MTVVVVAGALANKPGNGGEAWVRLSWLLGLRNLGVETWFVEQIDEQTFRDGAGVPAPWEASANLAWFQRVTKRFGLAERSALLRSDGRVLHGPAPEALHEALARADLLLNLSGNLTLEPLLRLPRRRAYVDLDPGYTQLWHQAGALGPALSRHEELLTVGLAIGGDACRLPLDGRRWRPVPPPVTLDEWPVVGQDLRLRFTTVASWRGGYGRVEHDGRLLGQKAHEFRRFATVPRESGANFEAALAIHPADDADAGRLLDGGWQLVDPHAVAGDPDAFRRYVQGSLAEFSPAQGAYVETRCGWFGDRTTRYLASGRPAVVQATGLPPGVPSGEGLLTFGTPAEAIAATEAVLADPARHARAARRIAEDCFDADRVVGAVLSELVA
ncbi:MAG TPA: hypothetical protein VKB03_04155 [Conexibacter sp.]|nr:hypothetical protein [Conexibacter sp.]